ncbi:hypothetical protein HII28_17150 [Planctomonas sp. JC2975]|uniref:hypothetical protein n=1 Tax=Planctomonas sp. JC2975 TaxID=2729626 RepID=UPI001473BBDD|nr:hypothetical protein [Planctomonas sp. JC2975]NNC13596.1 hypothetical protein [Planctomonas sp. JC2975]
MDDDIEPTPEQLLAALDAGELVESVTGLAETQRSDLLERVALLVGANRSISLDEFRSELADILDSGPTFHAVLHGGAFDGQVMELDPGDFERDLVCAAVQQASAAAMSGKHRARSDPMFNSLYRARSGEPGPGATVHYEFGGLVDIADLEQDDEDDER